MREQAKGDRKVDVSKEMREMNVEKCESELLFPKKKRGSCVRPVLALRGQCYNPQRVGKSQVRRVEGGVSLCV